jgi:cell division protein FtsW
MSASGFLPQTGIPLPFISYGGSLFVVCLWSLGILGNISKS